MSSQFVDEDLAAADPLNDIPNDIPNGGHDLSASKRKRRSTVRVACNACRTKKTRCDGRRPACGWCASRPGMQCVYDTETASETRAEAIRRENEILRRNLDHAEGLLHNLATLSEKESIELLKRLRFGGKGVDESFSATAFRYLTPSNSSGTSWTSKSLPTIESPSYKAAVDHQPALNLQSKRLGLSTSSDLQIILSQDPGNPGVRS